jgi:hypothetical protein
LNVENVDRDVEIDSSRDVETVPEASPEPEPVTARESISPETDPDTVIVDPEGGLIETRSESSNNDWIDAPENQEPTEAAENDTRPRTSGRDRRGINRFDPNDPSTFLAFKATEGIAIPKSYPQAMADLVNRANWDQAIKEEINKLQALGTWEYQDLPIGKKAVGCKWVFTIKYTPTGVIDRYKARLVAQGFTQIPGDDFLETFSPTIRSESLRTLLAIATIEGLEIRQLDVVSAYPRSELHAEVYMRPPEALDAPKGKVLRLRRSLYGLKQSGREWYIEACKGLKNLGFYPCHGEPSVFTTNDRSLIIGLYVDDMLILGADIRAVKETVKAISKRWEIKDLGDVSQILGLQVNRDREKGILTLSQRPYVEALIKEYGLEDAKPITTPISDRNALTKGRTDEILADQNQYQRAIGSLMWISRGSRFDIQFVVGQLSQHCNSPTVRHWNAVIRVIRYLKGTIDYTTEYRKDEDSSLRGYCDADYAGDTDDRKSVSGHIFILGGGPVTWTSIKQRCVATSTTESEYIALSEACKQGQWIRGLLISLQRTGYLRRNLAIPINSDNQGCIALAKDPVSHSRTKHIDVRYHYIRELVSFDKTVVGYVPTEDNIADVLTKPLPLSTFQRCVRGLKGP